MLEQYARLVVVPVATCHEAHETPYKDRSERCHSFPKNASIHSQICLGVIGSAYVSSDSVSPLQTKIC